MSTKNKYPGVSYKEKNNVKTFSYGYMCGITGIWKRKTAGTSLDRLTEAKVNQIRLKVVEEQKNLKFGFVNKNMSVNDAQTLYFKQRSLNNPNSTKSIKNDQNLYKQRISSVLGEYDLSKIIKSDIINFKAQLMKTNLSNQTINNILTLLSSITNYGINELDINATNYVGTHVKKLKVSNKRERFLSLDEIAILFNALTEFPLLLLFVKLAVFTGARAHAILHIQVKDITSDGVIQLNDFKTNSRYQGFINFDAIDLSILKSLQPNDYVVGGKDKPLTDSPIAKPLRVIFNELFNGGLEKDDRKQRVTIHTLRHSFASNLVIAGTPIYNVSKMLNHSSVQVTERYAKFAPNAGVEDARNFSNSIIDKLNHQNFEMK